MIAQDQTIGFIGAGNMGGAMIGAILATGLAQPRQIRVFDPQQTAIQRLQAEYEIQAVPDNATLFRTSDIIILAVKPQVMSAALKSIDLSTAPPADKRRLIVSIAAGTRLEILEKHFYTGLSPEQQKHMPIIRVMPNTPALVLAGMSGMAANAHATDADIETTRSLLSAMGEVRQFDESAMDAVTAVSGSGPAYVFYFIEAMIEAGQKLGLSAQEAAALVRQTFSGALKLLDRSGQSPQALREQVTSPGGTTAAALAVFDRHNLRQSIAEALDAAAKRGAELSRPDPDGS